MLDTYDGMCMASRALFWVLTLLTSAGQSGSPILKVGPKNTLQSIGVHCAGWTFILGSAIGHEGNHLDAFRRGLASANIVGHISASGKAGTVEVSVPLSGS